MVVDVAFIADTGEDRALAHAAEAFLNAGDTVRSRCIPPGERVGAGELTVGLRASQAAELHLVDAEGYPWDAARMASVAVRSGTEDVTVRLATREGVASAGRVGVLRSVAATVQAGRAVLGPLVARYAAGNTVLGAPTTPGTADPELIKAADRRGTMRFAGRLARAAVTTRNWQVAELAVSIEDLVSGRLPGPPVTWQGPSRRAFWADPCLVAERDQRWLFVEELGKRSGLGIIRAARVEAGRLQPHASVLRTPHHLSYPQVYRLADRWLASVETCAAHNPLYTFERLGDPWRPATDLPALPDHLADAVLAFDDSGRPTHAWGTDATVNADSVYVHYLYRDGAWRRDDHSVAVDVRLARGGGTRDAVRGWRSVQDCAGTYGRAATIVDESGQSLQRITGAEIPASTDHRRRKGVHTLTWTADGTNVWCDGWLRRVTPLGGVWRLRERQHSKSCDG